MSNTLTPLERNIRGLCWHPDCQQPGTVEVEIVARGEYTGPASKEDACGWAFACPDHLRAIAEDVAGEDETGYHWHEWQESWPA